MLEVPLPRLEGHRIVVSMGPGRQDREFAVTDREGWASFCAEMAGEHGAQGVGFLERWYASATAGRLLASEHALTLERGGSGSWTVVVKQGEDILLMDVLDLRKQKAREALVTRIADTAPSLDLPSIERQLLEEAQQPYSRNGDSVQGHSLVLADPDPDIQQQDGAQLLSDLVARIRRHIVISPEAADAIALWVVHTWLLDDVQTTPYLGILSPLPRCGKSTLLDLLGALVRRPLQASHATPPALFRVVESSRPTLLLDELDSFLKENEELRGMLNSGHSRAGCVLRVVGEDLEPRAFSTFSAKALAGIGRLPPTVADRSVIVSMQRKTPSDHVERLDLRSISEQCLPLRMRCRRYATDAREVSNADPQVPEDLDDRAADGWRILLAIADHAGGDWPQRARAAATSLSADRDGSDRMSLSRLLQDIQAIFTREEAQSLASERVTHLLTLEGDSPWTEFRRGRPLTQKQLADLLRPVGVRPRQSRAYDGSNVRCYFKEDFADAWKRYLGKNARPESKEPSTPGNRSATPLQAPFYQGQTVADAFPAQAPQNPSATLQPAQNQGCSGVAHQIPGEQPPVEQAGKNSLLPNPPVKKAYTLEDWLNDR